MDENRNNETRMVLRTEGLVKRYGKRTVVNDVSIDVKQGEIVGRNEKANGNMACLFFVFNIVLNGRAFK